MMASHQVVIVREAQSLRKIEDLQYYAENPLPSTILVLNYKYKTSINGPNYAGCSIRRAYTSNR
jgi:hypothetical protein